MKLPRLWPRRRSTASTAASGRRNLWPLNVPLLSWNEHDHVHLFDAVCGIQVFGATGSTKSSTTVENFSKSFLSTGFGAIYFSVKPDDARNYLRHAEECGRAKDVVLMGPTHPTTMNFIADGLSGANLAANVTAVLSIVAGMASSGASSGGSGREDGGFWEKMDSRLTTCATQLLMLSGQPVTTTNLQRLVLAIPRSREQVADEQWQHASYLFTCLAAAERTAHDIESRDEVARLADYFLVDLAQIGDRLRGTVQTSVGATLDLFNQPVARHLLSNPTPNFRLEELQHGKILIIDMPVMQYGPVARAIQKCVKYCFQQCQNCRDVATNPRPVAMVLDESQVLADLEHDAAFACTARGTRTVTLYATQSISNYLALAPGPQGEARVHALLGNLQCQAFHQTTDTKTVEYAQHLFGKHSRYLLQGGTQQQDGDWASHAMGFRGNGSSSASYSEHVDHDLQAEHFQRLAKGGPPHWISEAIVYQGGKHFDSTGRPYLQVRFRQRQNRL